MPTIVLRPILGLISLSLAWPATALGADDTKGPAWQQVPEDAAVVILFRGSDRHRGRIRSWDWSLQSDGASPIRHLETLVPWIIEMDNLPAPLTAATATRLVLWPDQYSTAINRQSERHEDLLTLNAGDLLILQLDADTRAPFARAVSAEAFATHLARQRGGGWRDVDHRAIHAAQLSEQHLAAVEITPRIDNICRDGRRTLRWHNARLEAELVDCSWQEGSLSYDDGTTVELSLPDLRARSVITGYVSPATGDVRFHTSLESIREGRSFTDRGLTGGVASLPVSGRLHAVDGHSVEELREQRELELLLRGAPGSTMRLTVGSYVHTSPSRRSEFELPRNQRATEGTMSSLFFPPKVQARLTYADASRYAGGIELQPAEDGHLPLPSPEGPGRRTLADGSGYEGRFENGAAEGLMWCFGLDDAGPCAFANGRRLSETGAILRSPDEILQTQPGFNRDMTIDLLRRQHIEALLAERWAEFLQLDSDLTVLGADTGVESLFYVARALAATGRPHIAEQRAMAYLNLAGAEGAAYGEALSLVTELRPAAERARNEREARLTELQELRATLPR